jgi:hypothetical protein
MNPALDLSPRLAYLAVGYGGQISEMGIGSTGLGLRILVVRSLELSCMMLLFSRVVRVLLIIQGGGLRDRGISGRRGGAQG